jgi:hypothetical protein
VSLSNNKHKAFIKVRKLGRGFHLAQVNFVTSGKSKHLDFHFILMVVSQEPIKYS